MDSAKQQRLLSALTELGTYELFDYSPDKAKEWASANLHHFVGANPSKLRLLASELREFAYSSNGMNLPTSEMAKKWVVANLHQFLNTDIQAFKKRFIELRDHPSGTRVIVSPPHNPTQPGYAIGLLDSPTQQYATEDGIFVDYGRAFIMREAVQFLSAKGAIAFAEMQGWIVFNKASSETIFDPPIFDPPMRG